MGVLRLLPSEFFIFLEIGFGFNGFTKSLVSKSTIIVDLLTKLLVKPLKPKPISRNMKNSLGEAVGPPSRPSPSMGKGNAEYL